MVGIPKPGGRDDEVEGKPRNEIVVEVEGEIERIVSAEDASIDEFFSII